MDPLAEQGSGTAVYRRYRARRRRASLKSGFSPSMGQRCGMGEAALGEISILPLSVNGSLR